MSTPASGFPRVSHNATENVYLSSNFNFQIQHQFQPFSHKTVNRKCELLCVFIQRCCDEAAGCWLQSGTIKSSQKKKKEQQDDVIKRVLLELEVEVSPPGAPQECCIWGAGGGQKSLLLLVVGEASADVQVTVMIYLFLYLSVSWMISCDIKCSSVMYRLKMWGTEP